MLKVYKLKLSQLRPSGECKLLYTEEIIYKWTGGSYLAEYIDWIQSLVYQLLLYLYGFSPFYLLFIFALCV